MSEPKQRERRIILHPHEIRGLNAGTVTQLRRVIEPQPEPMPERLERILPQAWATGFVDVECPYGERGDRLWGAETWQVNLTGDPQNGGPGTVPIYQEEHPEACNDWRPADTMPRWASRFDLDLAGVRVERAKSDGEGWQAGQWLWVLDVERTKEAA